ncbi:hypothetical protein [Streptomyces sp. NPDC020747]|uniref:hypothetical protein n=1 Tax=Streptomyces sp. NPDC020747 TaxID=3365086 RepID=UPI00379A3F1B
MTDPTIPFTDQHLNEYAVLAETAAHIGDKINPRVVTELVDQIRRLQGQRRYLIDQIAKKDAASGAADRKAQEFLAGGSAEQPSPTPLTDARHPADCHEPALWNDTAGNLLTIHPDTADDEDRPTVTLQIQDLTSEAFVHVAQTGVPQLAADLCAAAGFRELSEVLLNP